MASNKVELEIDVNTKSAQKNLSNFTSKLRTGVGKLKSSVFNLKTAVGALAGAFVFKKAFDTLAGLATIAGVQEDAINSLNSSLQLTGKYSKEASEDIQAYASELQGASKFGDEVILENAALIQSLGDLDKEGLKRATKASVDLAAALKIDLKSAATLVGKAAAGEVSSFSRYGVAIKKGATNAETLTNALTALEKKFGGAAANQIRTYSGAIQQASNTIGDFEESLGKVITQNPAVVKITNSVNKAFSGLITIFEGNTDAITEFINKGALAAFKALRDFTPSIKTVVKSLTLFKNSLTTLSVGFKTIFTAIAGINRLAASTNVLYQKLFGSQEDVAKATENWTQAVADLDTEVENLSKAAIENSEAWDKIGENGNSKLVTAFSGVAKTFADEVEQGLATGVENVKKDAKNIEIAPTSTKKVEVELSEAAKDEAKKKQDAESKYQSSLFAMQKKRLAEEQKQQDDVLNRAKRIGEGLVDITKGVFTGVVDNITRGADGVADALGTAIGGAASGLAKIAGLSDEAAAGIAGAFQGFISLLASGENLGQLIDEFIAAIPTVVDALIENIPTLINGILRALPALVQGMIRLIPQLISALADALPALILVLIDSVDDIILAFAQNADLFVFALIEALPELVNALLAAIPKVALALVKVGQKVLAGFLNGIQRLGIDFGDNIKLGATKFINGLVSSAGKFIKALANGIGDAIKDAVPNIGGGGGGGELGKLGKKLGFATGGSVVKGGIPGVDSVPALLQQGELVIDRTTGPRLMRFIDSFQGQTAAPSNVSNDELLKAILNELQKDQTVKTSINIGPTKLANAILRLNRDNRRLA